MRSLKSKFQRAQQAVASGFSDHDIKVVFDAKSAPYADLTNRVMHLTPLPDDIKDEDLEDIQGQCDHELGHFLFTDHSEWKTDKLEQAVLNSIEDGRIETILSERWFGMGENLDRSEKRALKKLRAIGEKTPGDMTSTCMRALCGLTLMVKGQSLSDSAEAVGGDTRPILEYLEAGGLLRGITTLGSTKDAAVLAVPIAKALKSSDINSETPKKGEGSSSGSSDSEESDEHGDGAEGPSEPSDDKTGESRDNPGKTEEDSSESADKGSESKEDGDESEGSSGSSEDEGDSEDSSGGSESKEDGDKSEGEGSIENPISGGCDDAMATKVAEEIEKMGLAQIRKDAIKEYDDKKHYTSCTDYDQYMTMDETTVLSRDREKFCKALEGLVPILRRKIQMEFQAAVRSPTRHQKKGKIDARSLWKHGCGSERIFKRRLPKLQVHADLVLLIDISGSMCGSKMRLAAQSAAAFSNVLDLIGVRHEVLAFTTVDSGVPEEVSRREVLSHITVKPLSKRYQSCIDNFVALGKGDHIDMRNNVDGEALLWAARRLCEFQQTGAKKAIVVFSDGAPAAICRGGISLLEKHLKDAVTLIEGAGIPIAGVGIKSRCVEEYYPRNVVVNDLENLGTEFLTLIREILRENVVMS